MQGVFAYEDFYAIHDHGPGSDHMLRVGGTVVFRNAGWTAQLRLFTRNANFGINPWILYLDMLLEPPPGGPTLPEVLTPTKIEELEIDPALHYREVKFQIVGTLDEPPKPVKVEHPE